MSPSEWRAAGASVAPIQAQTASFTLFAAAVYNAAWGAVVVLAPQGTLAFYGLSGANPPELWQCIGMLVGVYGIAYAIAAADPVRFWPLVAVGLLGKLLGPLGALLAVAKGALPASFLWVNASNDLLWLGPFGWLLLHARTQIRAARAEPPGASLYARAMGSEFAQLAPLIREFHSAREPIEVRGAFRIERGKGWLANRLTDLSGFPRAHPAVPVRLRVLPIERGEIWERHFGESEVTSWQCLAGGHLSERYGPLVLYLQPSARGGALQMATVRATLLGMPLPPGLTPSVTAHGIDRDGAIAVAIEVRCRPFGLLIAYSGSVGLAQDDVASPRLAIPHETHPSREMP